MNRPGWTHMAYHFIGKSYVEYPCFCTLNQNHTVKDTAPMKPMHYAVLRRPMNDQAMPCYCNKRKDHDLTPRTPLVNHLGMVWAGFEGSIVTLTSESYMKVAPLPKVMDKHAAPIFAALRDQFNKRARQRLEAAARGPF